MTTRRSVENQKSRYTQGGDTEVFQNRTGWWERDLTTLRERDDDVLITIAPKYDRRPDLLAADYLGNALLQWLVLQYNSIVDINEEFLSGKRIKLPDTGRANFSMLNKRTGGVEPKDVTIRRNR